MKAREGTWGRNSEATFGTRTSVRGKKWGDMSEFNLTRDSVQKEYEIALGPILFTPNLPFFFQFTRVSWLSAGAILKIKGGEGGF